MSKQITPSEIAEIVAGLLIKPELLNELETPEKHQAFFEDVAFVVSQHCGGRIGGISPPDTDENYMVDEFSTPFVSVHPDSDLPSLHNNVWSSYDLEADDGEEVAIATAKELEIEIGVAITAEQANKTRQALKSLFRAETHSFTMTDWDENKPQHEFTAEIRGGNQPSIEIVDADGEPVMGFIVEINKGVPAIHIDTDGGDALLHIHKAHDGLVLCPDSNDDHFEAAPIDQFSYNDQRALLIK